MTKALMTQRLVHFLRHIASSGSLPWLDALQDPRLGRAVDRILEAPSARHRKSARALARSGLSPVGLPVFDGELSPLRVAFTTERDGFLGGPFHVPVVHGDPLHEPHRRRSSAACAVHEGGFGAFGRDGFE